MNKTGKGRMQAQAWTYQERDILVAMWNDNESPSTIGKVLGKSQNSVSNYVRNHQDELGIKPRSKSFYKGEFNTQRRNSVEQSWSGPVPYRHWSITKPWGWSQSYTEALRASIRAGVEVRY